MFSLSAVLCVSILGIGSQSGLAQTLQPLQPQEPDWLIRMYEDGWQKVQEGVLQRGEGGSHLETFTYGEEGLRWHVTRLEEKVSFLESLYNNQPDPDLADAIDHLRGEILASNARLDSGQVGEAFAGEQLNNCDIAYGGYAYADPLGGSQAPGVTASANAYFHNNCGYVGDTFAHVYVQATTGTVSSTKTQDDPKYGGTWLDSAAQWTLGGSTGCYSEAYASASSSVLNISYSTQDTNSFCPATPLQVTVSGPAAVSLDSVTPCKNVTWTASVSGGVTPYSTINWYLGTTYVGSGSSYTQSYCNANETVTAKATVSDSASQAASGTLTTTISYAASALQVTVSGPDSVLLTSSVPCKNVTWTASVSGGVTPYSTISWYIGTTYVGSGSSYTRNYCSTSQTVTAQANVSDSASQTASGTKTTNISYFSGTTGGCSPGDCNCLQSGFTEPENSTNLTPIRQPCTFNTN